MLPSIVTRAALAAAVGAGAVTVAIAGPASAATECSQTGATVTCAVQTGNDGRDVGQATFTRTTNADGTTSVAVHGAVPDGISESQLCYQDTGPYTSRVSPGQCPLSQGNTGTTVDYTVNFPTGDTAKALYFQFHVVTKGDTAFAGWRNDSSPFYGNAEVDAAGGSTSVPVGTVGGLGLALALGAGLAVGLRRRRATSPAGVPS